jgi:RNA polymerase subunit RPABC4/transcription elongation factor Spt4
MSKTPFIRPNLCSFCKENIEEDAEICIFCGEFLAESAKHCKFCNRKIDGKAKICVHCGENQDEDRLGFKGKTVWDILSLILVPIILAVLAFVLPNSQATRQENTNAFKAYLDEMSVILTEEPGPLEDNSLQQVARARTVFVLNELDKIRVNMVLRYLREARLLDWILQQAHLTGVDLSGNDLSEANLSGANLRNAKLGGTTLVNLFGAKLVG